MGDIEWISRAEAADFWIIFLFLTAILGLYVFLLWQRRRKTNKFRERAFFRLVDACGLTKKEEFELVELVRRYEVVEHDNLLANLNTFDRYVAQEMNRVLSSAGSARDKIATVDRLYSIRKKTHRNLVK